MVSIELFFLICLAFAVVPHEDVRERRLGIPRLLQLHVENCRKVWKFPQVPSF